MIKFELRQWKNGRYFIVRSISIQKVPTIRLVASFLDVRGFFSQSSAELSAYVLCTGDKFNDKDYKISNFIASGKSMSDLKYKIPWLMI